MPRKKKTPFEEYNWAQKSIDAILAKYNGSKEEILYGKQMYALSKCKDKNFQQQRNDCRAMYRYEQIIREYEESLVARPAQDPPPTPAPQPQDSPCSHSSCNRHHSNDVSILF